MAKLSRKAVKREIIKKLSSGITSISLIIKDLELGPTISQKRTYSKDAMLKAIVFMNTKGIKHYRKLVMHLKNEVDDRRNLGFEDEVPTHQDLSHFVSTISEKEKKMCEFITTTINDEAEKYELPIDRISKTTAMHAAGLDKSAFNKEQKRDEILTVLNRLLIPQINFNTKRNSRRSKKEQLKVILDAARERKAIHSITGDGDTRRRELPASNTILYNLEKLGTKEIREMFISASDDILGQAKRRRLFAGRSFNIAIDYTLLHYYGTKDHPDIIERYKDRGTWRYFGFITVTIVNESFRFIAYTLPVFDDKRKRTQSESVKELLEHTRKFVDIKHVYADRGFDGSEMLRTLDDLGLKYVIPLSERLGIKRLMAKTSLYPFVQTDFPYSDYIIPYVCLIKGNRGIMKLATNINLKAAEINLIKTLPTLYSKRWGIETGYRVIKRGGLAMTSSNNYKVRLFYFMLAVTMYNAWIFLNLLMVVIFGKRDSGKYYFIFRTLLITILDVT